MRGKQRIKSEFPSLRMAAEGGGRIGICMVLAMLAATLVSAPGCGTTSAMYRKSADMVAEGIVENEQARLLGSSRDFNIDRPSDVLRQRLLVEQELPQASRASLGAYNLEKISFWPRRCG